MTLPDLSAEAEGRALYLRLLAEATRALPRCIASPHPAVLEAEMEVDRMAPGLTPTPVPGPRTEPLTVVPLQRVARLRVPTVTRLRPPPIAT